MMNLNEINDEKSVILDDGDNDYWDKSMFVTNIIECKKCGKVPKIPYQNNDGDCVCFKCKGNMSSSSKIYRKLC